MSALQRVRSRLSELAASIDVTVPRMTLAMWRWAAWPVLYAIVLGQTALAVVRRKLLIPLYETNKVPLPDATKLLWWTGGAFVAILVVYLAANAWVRHRSGAWRVVETTSRLNRLLAPMLAMPIVALLTHAAVERDSPKQTMLYIALAATAIGVGAYAWLRRDAGSALDEASSDEPAPWKPWREHVAKALAALAVAATWAGYSTFFSKLAVLNHHAMNTRTTDLGYYDNIFYQSIHGRFLGCSFIKTGYHGSAHFDPLLIALSPLYLLYPRAEMLLVLQSVWLGAGVVPVYLIAHEKLGRRLPAIAIGMMYALYPALHGANMYEFHSLTLATPLLLWLLYFLETGRWVGYWLVLVPVLLCREDMSLMACFVGLYALLAGRPGWRRVGWVTILVSVVYFAIVKKYFMTSADIFMTGKDSYSFAYYYEDLIPNKNGIAGLVVSMLTNPVFAVKTMLAEAKILYMLTLFVPLGFLPFVARPGRVLLVYGMLFCLLASRGAVFSVHFQYSATLIAFAFALTPAALRQLEEGRVAERLGLDRGRFSRAMLCAAFAASLLVSWKHGGFIENQTFKGGFLRISRTLTARDEAAYAWVDAQQATIPRHASVGVTNKMGAHVSNRKAAFFYPERLDTDYVMIDESELKGGDLDKHNKHSQKRLVVVSRHEKMVLYKKK